MKPEDIKVISEIIERNTNAVSSLERDLIFLDAEDGMDLAKQINRMNYELAIGALNNEIRVLNSVLVGEMDRLSKLVNKEDK